MNTEERIENRTRLDEFRHAAKSNDLPLNDSNGVEYCRCPACQTGRFSSHPRHNSHQARRESC